MAAPALQYNLPARITVEEYLQLEKTAEIKHEFVGGDIVAMAGASLEHNQIVSNLIRDVGSFLKGKGCDIFPSDFRVTSPAKKNYFYPDAVVVCGDVQLQEGVFDTLLNPVIIFEVVSEGTENIDRGYKFFHYQQIPSLQEYVLVDSRERAIDVIRKQSPDAWRFDRYSSTDKQIHLAAIDCTLLLDDLYYRVGSAKPE